MFKRNVSLALFVAAVFFLGVFANDLWACCGSCGGPCDSCGGPCCITEAIEGSHQKGAHKEDMESMKSTVSGEEVGLEDIEEQYGTELKTLKEQESMKKLEKREIMDDKGLRQP